MPIWLLATAAIVSWFPCRRATRVDPEALRQGRRVNFQVGKVPLTVEELYRLAPHAPLSLELSLG
jgi:hypothetical protein